MYSIKIKSKDCTLLGSVGRNGSVVKSIVLSEDRSLVSGIYIGQLTSTCDSRIPD